MKTKIEIIDEIIAHYSEDTSRRATEGSTCKYFTEDGRKCAVGYCMENPEKFKDFEGTAGALDDKVKGLDNVLKQEYRGHGSRFWNSLQELHDAGLLWGENELKEKGKEFVRQLKLKYNE